MKKTLTVLILFLTILSSCNDGDFDVPAFEFTDQLQTCGEYVLYKTSESNTEAIIMNLSSSSFSTSEGEKNIDITTSNSVSYRIFSESIGTDYFCQDIPPIEPAILKELHASSGTIAIMSTEILDNGTVIGYSHYITVNDLVFTDGEERILFETFEFGTLEINL